jgi:hypothetical protein
MVAVPTPATSTVAGTVLPKFAPDAKIPDVSPVPVIVIRSFVKVVLPRVPEAVNVSV